MINYTLSEINRIVTGTLTGNKKSEINNVSTDSRTIHSTSNTLFFAIVGANFDGHSYIPQLIKLGITSFVINKDKQSDYLSENINLICVNNTLDALQKLAAWHRNQYNIPVISITGSNGKTMVKEWLNYCLQDDLNITRSPKSYNSQIGVPLSVLQLNKFTNLAIFEAGISQPGEMVKLEKIIQPTIGVITNIGPPHQENFFSINQKISEKLELFKKCDSILYNADQKQVKESILKNLKNATHYTWSANRNTNVQISEIKINNKNTIIKALYSDKNIEVKIPFSDYVSVENAIIVLCILLYLKIDNQTIKSHFKNLPSISMRMELLNGVNDCTIINDIYNSDFESFKLAVDFLEQQKLNEKKTIILSDIYQSGKPLNELYKDVASVIKSKKINRFIGIGTDICKYQTYFPENSAFFVSTGEFLSQLGHLNFQNEIILLKGSRLFAFEKITLVLQEKTHTTRLEINLDAMAHNLQYFRSLLHPNTKIMVMVKAFSYGSGTYEIANFLEFNHVDYLAVAIVDEGVLLRQNGIQLPIVVMNPDVQSFEKMLEYNLEPEIYNFNILTSFNNLLKEKKVNHFPGHIKLDTGMHRLGFLDFEIEKLIHELKKSNFKIKSVFSHLAASDEPLHDEFTKQQYKEFLSYSDRIIQNLDYKILRHILNSSGIERFNSMQLDMVRLGIGLYGVSPIENDKLQNISTLKTNISQIKVISKNETVGYNRNGKVNKKSKIGILPIGYADGLNRLAGNGKWKVKIKNVMAPTIGNICMDMCMIDLTGIEASEGDEVEIIGNNNSILDMSEAIGTIPYEILTGISQRVKRIYYKS